MMYSEDEIRPELLKLYSELGQDVERIVGIHIVDYTYRIIRDDGAWTEIPRIAIDDYYGSEPGKKIARESILKALSNFRNSR